MEAILGVGGNVGDPIANVRAAVKELQSLGTLVQASDLYLTKPWGILDQPDFVNAVVVLDVDTSARQLLRQIKAIEQRLGRVTTERWGPRVIDIDILFYGGENIEQSDLIVPHPRWAERTFVLVPLAQIRSEFVPFLQRLPEMDRAQVIRIGAMF